MVRLHRAVKFWMVAMSVDGSNKRNLTPNTPGSVEVDPQGNAARTKVIGSGVARLTTAPVFEVFPTFSPHGSKFCSRNAAPPTGKLQLHTMSATGQSVIKIHSSSGEDEEGAYSPNGSKILFDSDRTGTFQLYLMNADRSNLVPLTTGSTENRYPEWSPDGTRIVFGSKRTGNSELFTMNADGRNVRQLTSNPGKINSDPSWSSGAEVRLAFSATEFNAGPFAW